MATAKKLSDAEVQRKVDEGLLAAWRHGWAQGLETAAAVAQEVAVDPQLSPEAQGAIQGAMQGLSISLLETRDRVIAETPDAGEVAPE